MRMSGADKAKSRARIIAAASRRFRESGIGGSGLSDVMTEAGMTHGGFYKHFPDKDALVRAALADAFDSFLTPLGGTPDPAVLAAFRDRYLSRAHRDTPGQGCPTAALAGDVGRADAATRQVMTDGIAAVIAQVQRHRSADRISRAAAIREFAALVGAVIIARAVDESFADEVLNAVRAGAGEVG